MERINVLCGLVSGALIIMIGLLATMEGILRGIFSSPTSWSLDLSTYILIWMVFLGTAYSFQEKGHVSVDLVKEMVGGRWGEKAVKWMTVAGYMMCLVVIAVLLWGGYDSLAGALKYGKLTVGNLQIPLAYLYSAMVAGSILMAVTVVFIILDLLGNGKKYL
jgi:TRAP-type C4-dicarboxylate transport system permease small subunit